MKFKEIFEKYKIGEVTDEEKEFIDEEIEKNEIINEYLADSIMDKFESFENENEAISVKKMKKKVDKKFRGIILKSIIGVVAIFSFIQIAVSPLTSLLFYNPSEILEGESHTNTLLLDTKVFTELHFPEYITSYATNSNDLGFGKHKFEIYQQNKFDNENTIAYGEIVRGKLETNGEGFYLFPYNNVFYEKGASTIEPQGKKEFDANIKLLEELPKSSVVASYLSFKEDMSIKKLLELQKKYDLRISWVAVRTDGRNGETKIGFNPLVEGPIIELAKEQKEVYPYLNLNSEYVESLEITDEVLETHYKSLLKYMSTREEFLSTFYNVNGIYNKYYKDSLRYIEDNGVKTYGIRIDSSADELIELLADENINSVFIQDAKFSVLER